jgi:hypothetical protein
MLCLNAMNTTNVVSSNSGHDEVHSMQHYVIKFVSDLRQVCGFLRVLWFPPPIKLDATILKIYFAEMDFFLFIKLTGNVMLKCYEFAKLIKDHLTHLCMPH